MKTANENPVYMFDTNVFNRVVDGSIGCEVLLGRTIFATHVQRDELNATRDAAKRHALLALFEVVETVPTSSAIWDVSGWDEAHWSDADGFYERLLARIRELDGRKRKSEHNQSRDALIAETAIKRQFALVTEDSNLARATAEFGGKVKSLSEFLAQ
jgi:predicted nucleic acid-binding protein